MKNKITLILFLLVSTICIAQKEITWKDLATVKYEKKYDPDTYEDRLYPHFSDAIKALEGKKVFIIGYYLNIDPEGKLFMVSKNPMATCFFCGTGGPETAVEIEFASPPTFNTDDIVSITGILKLNSDDPEHFNYILTQAVGDMIEQ